MFQYIPFRMKLRRLSDIPQNSDLREQILQNPQLLKQPDGAFRAAPGEHGIQLGKDPFTGEFRHCRSVTLQRVFKFTIQRKIQLGGKTHRPQYTQIILPEPFTGIADCTQNPALKIRHAPDKIQNLLPGKIVHQSVDGKIPALSIQR